MDPRGLRARQPSQLMGFQAQRDPRSEIIKWKATEEDIGRWLHTHVPARIRAHISIHRTQH